VDGFVGPLTRQAELAPGGDIPGMAASPRVGIDGVEFGKGELVDRVGGADEYADGRDVAL
jgi:hypothetical protein